MYIHPDTQLCSDDAPQAFRDTCAQIAMTLADMGYDPPRQGEKNSSALRKIFTALSDLQRRTGGEVE